MDAEAACCRIDSILQRHYCVDHQSFSVNLSKFTLQRQFSSPATFQKSAIKLSFVLLDKVSNLSVPTFGSFATTRI